VGGAIEEDLEARRRPVHMLPHRGGESPRARGAEGLLADESQERLLDPCAMSLAGEETLALARLAALVDPLEVAPSNRFPRRVGRPLVEPRFEGLVAEAKRRHRVAARRERLAQPREHRHPGRPHAVGGARLGARRRRHRRIRHRAEHLVDGAHARGRCEDRGPRHGELRVGAEEALRGEVREHARAAVAVAPEDRGDRHAGERGIEPRAIERAEGAQRLQPFGHFRARRVEEDHHRRLLQRRDLEERDQPLGLGGADGPAREAVLDQGHAHRAAVEAPLAEGEVAEALGAHLDGERLQQRVVDVRGSVGHGRSPSASATTASGWRATRAAPWAICWRQLVPAATIVAPAAARTAGSSAASPIFIDTS
jgi:hypothetical protein